MHGVVACVVPSYGCGQVCKYSGDTEYNVEVQTSCTESKRDRETFSATGHIPRSQLAAMGNGRHDALEAWSSHIAESRVLAIGDGSPRSQLMYSVHAVIARQVPSR